MKIRLCVQGAVLNYVEPSCKVEGFPKEGWEFVNGKHWFVLPGTSKSWIGSLLPLRSWCRGLAPAKNQNGGEGNGGGGSTGGCLEGAQKIAFFKCLLFLPRTLPPSRVTTCQLSWIHRKGRKGYLASVQKSRAVITPVRTQQRETSYVHPEFALWMVLPPW